MPTIRELQAITRRLRRSGIDSIEIQGDGYRVRIRCGAEEASLRGTYSASPTPADVVAISPQPDIVELAAPMPGRIWLQDPLTGRSIAADGRTVKSGDLLALLQVGPITLPLRATTDGLLDDYAVAQGDRVEYGQPVARMVKTEAAQ